jgi:hypothetical protein
MGNTAMYQNQIEDLAQKTGRYGDDTMGHLTSGDVVIPRDIVLENPEFLVKLKKAMQGYGVDYRGHVVGSGYENKNPETGAPEFFFKKLFSIAAPVLGYAFGGPIGAAAASGVSSKLSGGSTGDALKSAVLGGVGSYVGQRFLPSVGPADSIGGYAGRNIAGMLPSAVANAGISGAAGALAPQFLSAMGGEQPQQQEQYNLPQQQQVNISRQNEASLPSSLSQFSGLDPLQKATGIATEGLYGAGAGEEEKNYFLNLVNRRFVDDSGTMADYSTLRPIEQQFLTQGLGLRFDPNTRSLLESIAKRA